mmetsp:Transcript_74660/g.218841  ORF Transcript_74660/g.218841 Transcript_74660/m.218841 type:complete len:95 (-) Transcript_74660:932-1216(-)
MPHHRITGMPLELGMSVIPTAPSLRAVGAPTAWHGHVEHRRREKADFRVLRLLVAEVAGTAGLAPQPSWGSQIAGAQDRVARILSQAADCCSES